MARVIHVARAQQRYETIPVIDPETGQPKRTPVMTKRTGEQKTSKQGPVFRTVTVEDTSKPKPDRTCGACHQPIKVGQSYKYVKIKTSTYGSKTLARHEGCPNFQPWDLSDSLSTRIAKIVYDFETALGEVENADDVTAALEDLASEVESMADEQDEKAENIVEGFGHETESSEARADEAQQLRDWLDEIQSISPPDDTDDEYRAECETCTGTGEVEQGETVPCEECDGTGKNGDVDVDAYREAVQSEISLESPL